jgi:hypothetical protein
MKELEDVTYNWGLSCTRYEIKGIGMQKSMEKSMTL